MERDKFQCQSCGAKFETLHVHHRAYEKGKRIWETPDDDLVTLCESCHDSVEDMVRDIRRIGDKIAFLEGIGMAQFKITDHVKDIVNTAHKKPKWGSFALRTLDALCVSLMETSQDFDESP